MTGKHWRRGFASSVTTLALACGSAQAAPLQLQFTSAQPGVGSFTVDFEDLTGNGMLDFHEIPVGGFSGLLLQAPFVPEGLLDTIEFVPDVANVAVSNCPAGADPSICRPVEWKFANETFSISLDASVFDSHVNRAMPTPATGWLAVAALLALATTRRRRG